MKRCRATLLDCGYTGNLHYCSTQSTGAVSAWCDFHHMCTLDAAKELEQYGLSHLNKSHVSSGEVGSEYIWFTERGKDCFNNCFHRKSGGFTYPISGVFRRIARPRDALVYRHYKWRPYVYPVAPLENHPNVDLSLAQRTAWHTMQPEFQGNVSMLNFIYEMKDFREIVKALRNRPFRSLARSFRKWKKQRLLRRIDPSRPIAEGHLVNEFAIKPLISDILAITADLNTIIREQQEQFQLDGLEANTRHYSEDFVFREATNVGYYTLRSGLLEYTRFTATLSYTYRYSMRSQWDAFMRYWGLKLSAEVVWNALPFSFLFDYFYKVGNTIALLDHDPNVDLKIHAYCESLKSLRMDGLYWEGSDAPAPVLINNREAGPLSPVMGSKAELYTREVCSPNKGTVLPRIAMPSKGQWTNAAALVRALL